MEFRLTNKYIGYTSKCKGPDLGRQPEERVWHACENQTVPTYFTYEPLSLMMPIVELKQTWICNDIPETNPKSVLSCQPDPS